MQTKISELYTNNQFSKIIKDYSISDDNKVNRLVAMSFWQLDELNKALDIFKIVAQNSKEKIDYLNCILLSLELSDYQNIMIYLKEINNIELSESKISNPTLNYCLKYIFNKIYDL